MQILATGIVATIAASAGQNRNKNVIYFKSGLCSFIYYPTYYTEGVAKTSLTVRFSKGEVILHCFSYNERCL